MAQGHRGGPRRRLPARPRLTALEDRAVPSITSPGDPPQPPVLTTTTPVVATPIIAVGAEVGNRPIVRVIDSATGETKFQFEAYESAFRGGVRVATGDVNGDGVADIVTAPGPSGGPLIKVFDGVTGSMLNAVLAYDANFRGGVYVAVGDVNRDGFADIVTGAGEGGGPHVRVVNGAWVVPPLHTMSPLNTIPTLGEGDETAPPTEGQTTTGGETTALPPPIDTWTPVLSEFMAYDGSFRGGVRVATGDVTGDGLADIITAAGPGGGPHVRIYDSTSGQVYREFMAYASTFTGGVYVTAGDVDGDGRAEVATGMGPRGGSRVNIYSGETGAPVRSFMADNANPSTAARVRFVDFDNDGRIELLVGLNQRIQIRDPNTNTVASEVTPLAADFVNGLNLG